MTSKILKPFNKVMGVIGLVDEEDNEIEDKEELDQENDYENNEPDFINRKNKLVSIKTNSSAKVILKRPNEFQDIMEVVDSVKSRKIVIMNMTEADSKQAQRMIDYIVGACYALNGSFQEIAKCIYIVVPDGVDVSNELKQELNRSDFFSFDR